MVKFHLSLHGLKSISVVIEFLLKKVVAPQGTFDHIKEYKNIPCRRTRFS